MGGLSTRTSWILVPFTVVAVVALAGSPPASAHATDCRYTNKEPKDLTTKQAHKAVRCLVNVRRSAYGEADVLDDRRLRKAASRHTRRMTSENCFAHQCPGEGPLGTRLFNTGYLESGLNLWGYSEAIGWGTGVDATPRKMVQAWMGSPPHRNILLAPRFEHLGIGFKEAAPTSSNANAGTYTLDFGFRNG
jgi:uncharacterized protein YkwD